MFCFILTQLVHAKIQEGVDTPSPPSKNLSNTGLDPLKNHNATKPAINVGQSSARQRNAISMAFPWQLAHSLCYMYLYPLSPLLNCQTPSGKTIWIRACSTSTKERLHLERTSIENLAFTMTKKIHNHRPPHSSR